MVPIYYPAGVQKEQHCKSTRLGRGNPEVSERSEGVIEFWWRKKAKEG
jgi:hypothetical protein